MALITIVGPLSEEAARETARYLGDNNHGVYSKSILDPDGFDTDDRVWFVERDTDAMPSKILGYDWSYIQSRQQKR